VKDQLANGQVILLASVLFQEIKLKCVQATVEVFNRSFGTDCKLCSNKHLQFKVTTFTKKLSFVAHGSFHSLLNVTLFHGLRLVDLELLGWI